MAVANASIRATIDRRARSIFRACAISNSQSSGPAKPFTERTGANSVGAARGGSSRRKFPPRVRPSRLPSGQCRSRSAVRPAYVKAQPWPTLGQCRQGAPGGPVGRAERDMNGILPSRQHGPPPRLLTGDSVLGDMSQWLGRAPMFPQPGERHPVARAKSEHLVRHRDERVQIERTRLARSHTCNGTLVATANSFAQLSGEHPRPGHAQRARLRGRVSQAAFCRTRVFRRTPAVSQHRR
jgi:hypothetical protein